VTLERAPQDGAAASTTNQRSATGDQDLRRARLTAALEALDPTGTQQVLVLVGAEGPEVGAIEALLAELRPGVRTLEWDAAPTPAPADPNRPVQVLVLGPVEVRGTEGSLIGHPKLTELLVFLSMHTDGSTSETWSAALWPDKRVPQQTIANRLSEARRVLGFASDDRPRMRKRGERHLLVETPSDWEDFQRLANTDDPACWQQALSLVRGRPFEGLQQGQWVVLEGFASEVEQVVVACALCLGRHALAHGDAEIATFAAQRGMRANPFDERLHRLYMSAAAAQGNRAGVVEALQRLGAILELEGDPLDGVHPETAALYESLLRAQ
jgi:DNA-binding SARP family transcriptional activator